MSEMGRRLPYNYSQQTSENDLTLTVVHPTAKDMRSGRRYRAHNTIVLATAAAKHRPRASSACPCLPTNEEKWEKLDESLHRHPGDSRNVHHQALLSGCGMVAEIGTVDGKTRSATAPTPAQQPAAIALPHHRGPFTLKRAHLRSYQGKRVAGRCGERQPVAS